MSSNIYNKKGQEKNHMNLRRVSTCYYCKYSTTSDEIYEPLHITCKKFPKLVSGWEIDATTICDYYEDDS